MDIVTQDVETGNVEIVKFMGYLEINDHPEYDRWFTSVINIRHFSGYAIHELLYHSDWNWLHEAWDKFSKIQLREDENDNWNDTYNKHLETISTAIIHFSIKTAHKRLVNGINWYNKNLNHG